MPVHKRAMPVVPVLAVGKRYIEVCFAACKHNFSIFGLIYGCEDSRRLSEIFCEKNIPKALLRQDQFFEKHPVIFYRPFNHLK